MEPTSAPEATTAAERIAGEFKLDVDHAKPQEGKGKRGSLANPEVYVELDRPAGSPQLAQNTWFSFTASPHFLQYMAASLGRGGSLNLV